MDIGLAEQPLEDAVAWIRIDAKRRWTEHESCAKSEASCAIREAMAAMHGVVVCLLTVASVMGRLRLRSLLRGCGIGIAVTAAVLFALGLLIARAIPYAYTG